MLLLNQLLLLFGDLAAGKSGRGGSRTLAPARGLPRRALRALGGASTRTIHLQSAFSLCRELTLL